MSEEEPRLSSEDWEAFDRLPPQVKWFMRHVHAVTPVSIVLELYESKIDAGADSLEADKQVVAALKNLLRQQRVRTDFRPVEKRGSENARPPTYIGSSVRALEQAGWELG